MMLKPARYILPVFCLLLPTILNFKHFKMRWSFVCIVILLTACTKEVDFKLPDTKPLYVIEGRISDLQGPYYIRITRSTNLLGNQTDITQTLDNADAVQGAAVIIKDDMGTI